MKPILIHEEKHYLIIHKPAGLIVHGDGKTKEPTLVDWILKNHPTIDGVGEDWKNIKRPGIVHRLDRDTEGLLVIAKTNEFFSHIKKCFQNHTVEKEYHCLVYGHPKWDEKTVDQSISKNKNDFRKWTASGHGRGQEREAVTTFSVNNRFQVNENPYTYIIAKPKTGRTHQIRVHLKFLHHPIAADPLYAGKKYNPKTEPLEIKYQALLAYKIGFKDLEGNNVTYKTNLPPIYQKYKK